MLRLVVLETRAACVQLAHDFLAADVGLPALDPSKTVQVGIAAAGRRLASLSFCIRPHRRFRTDVAATAKGGGRLAQALRSPSCWRRTPRGHAAWRFRGG